MYQEKPYLFLVDSDFWLNEPEPPEIPLTPEQHARAKALVEKHYVRLIKPNRAFDDYAFTETFRLIYSLNSHAHKDDVRDLLLEVVPADVVSTYAFEYRDHRDHFLCLPIIERGLKQTAKLFGAVKAVYLMHNCAWITEADDDAMSRILRELAPAALAEDPIEASSILIDCISVLFRPDDLKRDISGLCLEAMKGRGGNVPEKTYVLRTNALEKLISNTPDACENPAVQNAIKDWLQDYSIQFLINLEDKTERDTYCIFLSRIGQHVSDDNLLLFEKRTEELMAQAEKWGPGSVRGVTSIMREQWLLTRNMRAVFKDDSIPPVNPKAGESMNRIIDRYSGLTP